MRLLLFARPSEETARQIEARLGELLAADTATEADYSGTGAVPAPLQHAVDVLLDLVADVERVTQRRAGALALYQSSREVACAYVGGGEPDVWSHDQRYEAPWVALREGVDEGDGAPVARGFAVFAREDLNMRLQWPYLLGTPKPEGVVVEACWRAPRGFEVTVRELSGRDLPHSEQAGLEGNAESAGGDGNEERGEFFAGWFDDLTHGIEPAPTRAIPPLPQGGSEAPQAVANSQPPAAPSRLGFPDLLDELRTNLEDAAPPLAPMSPPKLARESVAREPVAPQPFVEEHVPPTEEELAWVAAQIAAAEALPSDAEFVEHIVTEARVSEAPVAPQDRSHIPAPETYLATPDPAELFTPEPVGATLAAAPAAEPDAAFEPAGSIEDADGFAPRPRAVRRPEWPAFVGTRRREGNWKQHAGWAGFIAVLFAIGWYVGTRGIDRSEVHSGRAPFAVQAMRAIGLASPRFTVRLLSSPAGALISVDGKLTAYRTPAEIELVPGSRRIGLTLSDLGTVNTVVEGKRGATVQLNLPLTGSLVVSPPDHSTPVSISLDGEERGFAPLEIQNIAPGAHELIYTSPGQPPWTQTVTVPLRGDVRIVARPFDLPASGVIHIGATWTDDDGSSDLRGAVVTVDGERRGSTPLTLELPRGPHSLRAEYRGEDVPVQVIDLPGGNERFASFSFGTGAIYPKLSLMSPLRGVPRDVPTPVSVSLQGLFARDVREVWLHVRAQDGAWRRYPMNVTGGNAGPVATVIFPSTLLDARGDAPFYVSTLVSTGEEYFTDIYGSAVRQPARAAKPVRTEGASPATPKPSATRSERKSGSGTVRITPTTVTPISVAPVDVAPLPDADLHPSLIVPPNEPPATPTTP